jgi:hypothetical protein
MNSSDYLRERYKQLNDQQFYQKLDSDPKNKIAININKVIQEIVDRNLITDKMASRLIIDNPKPGRFYLLPKIHKKGNP